MRPSLLLRHRPPASRKSQQLQVQPHNQVKQLRHPQANILMVYIVHRDDSFICAAIPVALLAYEGLSTQVLLGALFPYEDYIVYVRVFNSAGLSTSPYTYVSTLPQGWIKFCQSG